MSIMGIVFCLLAGIAAWRVVAADGRSIWYVPAVIAFAAASMFFGAWRLRGRSSSNQ